MSVCWWFLTTTCLPRVGHVLRVAVWRVFTEQQFTVRCCSGSDGEGLWHTERRRKQSGSEELFRSVAARYPEEDWLQGIQIVARRYKDRRMQMFQSVPVGRVRRRVHLKVDVSGTTKILEW